MRLKMIHLGFLICISLYSLNADIYLKEKQTTISDGDKTQNETSTYWITEDKLKKDSPGQSIIIRLDKNAAYIVNHGKKSYQEISFEEIANAAPQTQDMSGLPPMVQNMMKMKVTIVPQSEKKSIGEWNCNRYDQTIEIAGGTTVSEMWATKDVKVNPELFRKFHTAMFLKSPAMAGIAGNFLEETKKIKGFVVSSKSVTKVMGTQVESSSELTEVKDDKAPKGTWDIPANYKKESWDQ